VKIPGILVDLVVVDPDQRQSYLTDYSPAFAGELRVPADAVAPLALGARKVIARRAALELFPAAICNLGSGVSTGLAAVAAEEGILDRVVLTNEQGLIGGAPASGVEAGAGTNYSAMIDQPYQFDFYDGGGLDLAFLSFAQVDAEGNVNVSRFGERIIGVGGFMNISQNARRVIFSGTFTAGGLELDWPDGRTRILREGRAVKFVDQVQQLTFNGAFGRRRGQDVLYVTERAVFQGGPDGPELIEVAPGLDVDRDVLANMQFRPRIAAGLREMDPRLFRAQPMGLSGDIERRAARPRPQRVTDVWPQPEPPHV
jgi:propionate CoA-transferase